MSPRSRPAYDLFVDSAGFYALASDRDAYHKAATAVVRRAPAEGLRLFTTNFVLAEAHALFLARQGRAAALSFVQRVLAGSISVERGTAADEAVAVAILERYSDKDFSYTDATSFAVMRRFSVDAALTSDRHFAQFGFRQA